MHKFFLSIYIGLLPLPQSKSAFLDVINAHIFTH